MLSVLRTLEALSQLDELNKLPWITCDCLLPPEARSLTEKRAYGEPGNKQQGLECPLKAAKSKRETHHWQPARNYLVSCYEHSCL